MPGRRLASRALRKASSASGYQSAPPSVSDSEKPRDGATTETGPRAPLRRLGRIVARRLNGARGPVSVVAPARGFSQSDTEGGALWRSEERRGGKECRSRWSPYH